MKRSIHFAVAAAILLCSVAGPCCAAPAPAPCRAAQLRCEYLENPLGLDETAPRFYWQMEDARRGARQSAYQVIVASSRANAAAAKGDTWDSGRVEGNQSTHVAYGGPALAPCTRYWWSVRVWDKDNAAGKWSEPAYWETGLLDDAQWKAQWIGRDFQQAGHERAPHTVRWIRMPAGDAKPTSGSSSRRFRRTFDLTPEQASKITSAVLLAVADSGFAASLNGTPTAKSSDRTHFSRANVATERFRAGRNVLAVSATKRAGGPATLAAALLIGFADGTQMTVVTDQDWLANAPKKEKWQAVDYNDSAWKKAVVAGKIGDAPWGKIAMPVAGYPAALLRKSFDLPAPPAQARVYVAVLGSYKLFVNGQAVAPDTMAPDWVDYRKRTPYQTYDITPMLVKGRNAVGAIVGDGWYNSPLGPEARRDWFGPRPPRMKLEIHALLGGGTSATIVTDDTWKAAMSPVLRSEIYAGEIYDARLEQTDWAAAGFDDGKWQPAQPLPATQAIKLDGQYSPPIRVTETLKPKAILPLSNNRWVVDMGQNMPGWLRVRAAGPAGTSIRMAFAEVLNPDGTVYRDNLRSAEVTDHLTLRGAGTEVFEPHFTYRGFRYAQIHGYPGKPGPASFEGRVAHTDLDSAGTFECSNELVNRIWLNTRWGLRANMFSVPTDCPQRDERLGWTGDAQAIWRTACYAFDMAAFSAKWAQDLRDSQGADGSYPNVAPRAGFDSDGAPAWGDAGIICPASAYRMYADNRLLERHWESMEKWMELIAKHNPDFTWTNRRTSDYGDWLAVDESTPKDLVATVYWAYDARLMAEMAAALGKADRKAHYDEVYGKVRSAFQQKFVAPDGKVGTGSQTCQVLALHVGLVPDDLRKSAVAILLQDIEKRGGHLSTGFLGTTWLLFVLSDNGADDVAYRLVQNDTYPSWGYMIRKGATTIWERWNTDTGDPAMNSHNHYCFGAVAEWLYRYAAGIDTGSDTGGFQQVRIRPRPGPGIDRMKADYRSLHGTITSAWTMKNGRFELAVTIPANTTAVVEVPVADAAVAEKVVAPKDAVRDGFRDGRAVFKVSAGRHEFRAVP